MVITDIITITELSRLTQKSRPTLYKYVNDYKNNNLDEIPYSFIKLFDLARDGGSKNSIIDYCKFTYGETSVNKEDINKIFFLISENADKIDLKKIINIIEEEIKDVQ